MKNIICRYYVYMLQLFYYIYIIWFTHFLSSLRFNLDNLFDIHTSNLIYLIYCTSPIKNRSNQIKSIKTIYQSFMYLYLPIYLPSPTSSHILQLSDPWNSRCFPPKTHLPRPTKGQPLGRAFKVRRLSLCAFQENPWRTKGCS